MRSQMINGLLANMPAGLLEQAIPGLAPAIAARFNFFGVVDGRGSRRYSTFDLDSPDVALGGRNTGANLPVIGPLFWVMEKAERARFRLLLTKPTWSEAKSEELADSVARQFGAPCSLPPSSLVFTEELLFAKEPPTL